MNDQTQKSDRAGSETLPRAAATTKEKIARAYLWIVAVLLHVMAIVSVPAYIEDGAFLFCAIISWLLVIGFWIVFISLSRTRRTPKVVKPASGRGVPSQLLMPQPSSSPGKGQTKVLLTRDSETAGATPRFEKEATKFSKSAIAEVIAAAQLLKSKGKDPTAIRMMATAIVQVIQCCDCGHKFTIQDGMKKEYHSSIGGECLAVRCTKCGIRRFWVA